MGGMLGERTEGEMAGLDIAEQRSWSHFVDASVRMYAAISDTLATRHQLSLGDVRLLEVLARQESGALRMGELAGQLLTRPSGLTRQIRRLQAACLVRRDASTGDGRGVMAAITPQGRTALAEAMVTYSAAVRELYLSPLTRAQMAGLGESCRRISTALTAGRLLPGQGRRR